MYLPYLKSFLNHTTLYLEIYPNKINNAIHILLENVLGSKILQNIKQNRYFQSLRRTSPLQTNRSIVSRILAGEGISTASAGLEVTKKGERPRVPSEPSRHFVYSPPRSSDDDERRRRATATGPSLSRVPSYNSFQNQIPSSQVAVNLLRKVEKLQKALATRALPKKWRPDRMT